MRLFNVHTRAFEQFYASVPAYAIASHRWAPKTETSYEDVHEQRNTHKEGYKKLEGFVEYVQTHVPGVDWLWIDTCCIDQKNNAELSEAINSMFKWYQNAVVCLAYLADVSHTDGEEEFRRSEWFSRGWTLQELIAPQFVIFLTKEWQVIGYKGVEKGERSRGPLSVGRYLSPLVAQITGIPDAVLDDNNRLEEFSKEDRMTWVNGRSTTREEDMWYCLVGIVDAAIGANYGEGAARAKRRLLVDIGLINKDLVGPKPSFNIPFRRDPDYIDRSAIVAQIDRKLAAPAAKVALVGLGGVGKSQLAIEYCYRLREQSPDTSVIWIHASNAARFEQGIREMAEVMKIPGRQEAKAEIFKLVWGSLRDETKGRWFIVLDNVDDASFLLEPPIVTEPAPWKNRIDYLPVCEHGSILITSRSTHAAKKIVEQADMIFITPMMQDDAVLLLEKKLGQDRDRTSIANLAEALEFIPLALTQAASYIVQQGKRFSIQRYLEKLQKINRPKQGVLDTAAEDHRRDRDAQNAILITWQISFEHVRRTQPSAADLLSIMSFCDPQAIPELLLRRQKGAKRTVKQRGSADTDGEMDGDNDSEADEDSDCTDSDSEQISDDSFDMDIATLEGYSFVSVAANESVFEMHRLVQQATQIWLRSQGLLEGYKEQYIDKLESIFPTGEYENWNRCQQLFPHVRLIVQQRPQGHESLLQWASIMYVAAWYALTQGNASDALEMSSCSIIAREKVLGKEHLDTLKSVSNLASALKTRGQYKAAEEMHRRALEGREKVLGKEHPDTLTSINNLASALERQGQYEAAEEIHRRALEGREKVLGKEHPDTLSSVNNLALALYRQGQYKAAEEMHRRALEGCEKVLGKEHPDTLTSINNLALALERQGQYKAAEEMHRRALEGCEKVLGKEHPDTLSSVNNLASALERQGQYKAAEEMHRQALEGREKVLGKEHPDTLSSVNNLALALESQGQYEAAEEIYRRALEGREKVLGKEHPDTLSSVNNLALALERQGQYEAAEEMYRRALEGCEKVLGKEHPDTLTSVNNLALALERQGQYKEAK